MWEKVLAFFNNKTTKYVEFGIIAVAVIGLLIGGITSGSISDFIGLISTIAVALVEAIKFVVEIISGKKAKRIEETK